ncbi:GspE/PulE family protein [Aliidiomarina iranensis]|uniref:GspE/PulE family protein n=1 Tax=Aliidiomarina iranensis TaxID=1434071 RepID=UPI00130058C2|nr:ATPase, T2SS/T4P/T4SS family [Aliidiomarina iranensis]
MHTLNSELTTFICTQAKQGVSDLHLEAQPDHYRWRGRRLGLLEPIAKMHVAEGARIIAALKTAAGLDTTERRLPQDGRLHLAIPNVNESATASTNENATKNTTKNPTPAATTSANQSAGNQQTLKVDCRINTLNTLHGEKLVLRLQLSEQEALPLSALGLLPQQRAVIEKILKTPEGLILVTGPTGSGKTRTLYAMLQILAAEAKNIATVEDPVEVTLANVNQVPIKTSVGLTFATALRAMLRQDPDVLMVGEIRDAETAQIAVQAAQTGHLVLATLHASQSLSAIIRLQQLGVDNYQLAACWQLLINQRLITVDGKRRGVFTLQPMHNALRRALLSGPNNENYWQHLQQCLNQPQEKEAYDVVSLARASQ